MGNAVVEAELAEAWRNHPVVRMAHRGLEEGDLVGLFENMYEILTELDQRFPGLPLRCVLNADTMPPADRDGVRRRLLASGARQEDVDLAFPRLPGRPSSLDEPVFEALHNGATAQDLVDRGLAGSIATAKIYRAWAGPMSPVQVRIAGMLSEGRSATSIAKTIGCSVFLVHTTRRKAAYHAWREGRS